jgi:hypothetical protein
MLEIKAALVTVIATLLVTLILCLTRAVGQLRQKRKEALRGLIPVPSFEDPNPQEELGPGVESVPYHLLSLVSK